MRTDSARSPLCYAHAASPAGRAWAETWGEQPEAVRAAIDFCPYCRDEHAQTFARQLRIGFVILAALAALVAYDWLVGQWRWNPSRNTNFFGDLIGTLLLFQLLIGGLMIAGWFAARGVVNRVGTPEQRWGWLGHKVLGVLSFVVQLGAPWVGMAL